MTYIYVDIETIPAQDEASHARIAAMVKPPTQMKKAETIAAWEREQKAEAVAEAISKTSFNAAFGHVCCISWAVDDGKVFSQTAQNVGQECDILKAFFDAASSIVANRFPTIVGHYVAGFDLRFVWQRSIVLGIRVPNWVPRDLKPWGTNIFDTMTAWAGVKDTISMDNLCQALGIEGKGDIDGSMVAQMFADGKFEDIAAYCRQDVERTRAIHRKMLVAFGEVAA